MTTGAGSLAGRTVAVPETREVDLFIRMLEDEGARTFRCPLVAILDAPDPKPIEAWLQRLADNEFKYVVLLTGEGLRRLIGFAERAGVSEPVRTGLANAQTIVRGPKPSKALREIGLSPTFSAETPTTAGVIATMSKLDLKNKRVGVQLYGQEPNEPLAKFFEEAGAEASFVAPYIYAPKSDDERVIDLIDRLVAGEFDVLALTSSPQVDRLFDVAKTSGRAEALCTVLRNVVVAAVGPVVAERLRAEGVEPAVMPERTFFLRPLVTVLANRMGGAE